MKTHLHKLSEGFIITSDEDIKLNDLVLLDNSTKELPDYKGLYLIKLLDETLLKSALALKAPKVIAQEPNIIFSSLKPEEQKEIGWFDAKHILKQQSWDTSNDLPFNQGFLKGFQKAQELLSDKVCTLKDLESIFLFGKQHGLTVAGCIKNGHDIPNTKENMNEVIQALYQNSWEVEIEMTDDKVKILRIL